VAQAGGLRIRRLSACPTKQHSRNQTPATAGGDRRTACPTKKSSRRARKSRSR